MTLPKKVKEIAWRRFKTQYEYLSEYGKVEVLEEAVNEMIKSESVKEVSSEDEMLPLPFVRSITGWAKDDLQRKYEIWKSKHRKP